MPSGNCPPYFNITWSLKAGVWLVWLVQGGHGSDGGCGGEGVSIKIIVTLRFGRLGEYGCHGHSDVPWVVKLGLLDAAHAGYVSIEGL